MTHLYADAEPITVVDGPGSLPQAFTWRGHRHTIAGVANRWRTEESWWGAEAWREYMKVATTDGLLCLLYRDLRAGGWFCARIYD